MSIVVGCCVVRWLGEFKFQSKRLDMGNEKADSISTKNV